MLRWAGSPLEHGTHPPSDLGNLARCPTGESPLQVIDEVRDGSAVVFFDECHPPTTPDVFGLATGFGERDCPLVVVDPLLNPLAALGEQTQKYSACWSSAVAGAVGEEIELPCGT